MKNLRAAVVGVGYLGTFHAQKYKNNPEVELIGVFDTNPIQAEKVATSLQVGVFANLESLVGKVDLVTVATSTQSHYSVVEFLLKNGIHVHVEKPITADSSQAEKIVTIARDKKLVLAVGHIERFNPAFKKWKIMMGAPKYLEFERMGPFKARGADVSVIHDLMIHDLDLLLSLNLGAIQSVEVQGAKLMSQTIDWAVAWLGFASGTKVCLKASRVSPVPSRTIRAFDSEAQWTVYLNSGEIDRVRFGGGLEAPLVAERITTEKVDGLQEETDAFIDSVLNNKVPFVTGEDGLLALKLAERIYKEIPHV